MDGKMYLAQVLQWSTAAKVELVELISSGMAMAGPILVFAAIGHLPLGLAASVGGLAVSGVKAGSSTKNQAKELASALIPVILAAVAAILLLGYGWMSDIAVVVLASLAAIIGGYSRAFVVATTRFILFLAITINVIGTAPNRTQLFYLIVAGAIWSTCLSLMLGALVRTRRSIDSSEDEASTFTISQKINRWRKSLTHLSGWQYTLRLALCLCIAEGFRWFWPGHHLYWIVLTVAILIERKVEPFPIKTTQRALGTVLGVIAASLFLVVSLPAWGMIMSIGLLAAVRPLLKVRNYFAYSASMTPLIMLIMNAGQSIELGVLFDRLIATLIGVGLVILVNLIFSRVMSKPA
ncbi:MULTISPECIES: FUSC family protein [unclassified Paenibacillus]|uniref:FUSC family protein n=1 Tax=unclassified Paenibacillus TaxID=185978 RepID=UPI003645A74E